MIRKIETYFDKLEDRVRGKLSKHPIVYALIGGIAIVLFWRGVWMTADLFPWMTGPVSIIIALSILLVTGLFVSFFVGDVIILSGVTKQKKLSEKTEKEVRAEQDMLVQVQEKLTDIEEEIATHHKS